MVRSFTRRRCLLVLLGVLSAIALVLLGRSLNATKRGGQGPAEPFRIAGNLYYIGASDVAAFLITGPEGHVVLDGGYPTTAPMKPSCGLATRALTASPPAATTPTSSCR